MGRTAIIIAVAFTIVCGIAILFMVAVALSTRGSRPETEEGVHRLREREKVWFVIVVVLLIAVLFATIFFTPYGKSSSPDDQVVPVEAVQFAWLVRGEPIKVGRRVHFELTSKDVNHGFAVYTSAGKFLFQVQVQPGYRQDYYYTFDHPGTYKILCLEYCGIDHDKMAATLEVTQ
jgi:cytochrome c oxidase subunit 2